MFQASTPGDNSTRTKIENNEEYPPHYNQIVLYDHITRRKT